MGPGARLPRRAARRELSATAAVDELDAVAVGIAHETEQRSALTHAIRLALGLDPLLLQLRERAVEVVHGERDVAVTGAEVVRAAVVVERQLELRILAGDAEEVVRRLLLAAADDVELATELEPERLIESPTLPGSVMRYIVCR